MVPLQILLTHHRRKTIMFTYLIWVPVRMSGVGLRNFSISLRNTSFFSLWEMLCLTHSFCKNCGMSLGAFILFFTFFFPFSLWFLYQSFNWALEVSMKKNFSFFFNYLFCFVIINNSAFEPLPNFSVCVQIFKIDSEQVERIDEDFEVFFSYTYLSWFFFFENKKKNN